MVTTPFSDKKSLTKDVDKGTGESEYMKEAVVKIHRKYLDKFEFQSKGYKGWFKLDSELNCFLQLIHNSIKLYEKDIEGQDTDLYKTFFVPFDK